MTALILIALLYICFVVVFKLFKIQGPIYLKGLLVVIVTGLLLGQLSAWARVLAHPGITSGNYDLALSSAGAAFIIPWLISAVVLVALIRYVFREQISWRTAVKLGSSVALSYLIFVCAAAWLIILNR